ncbi:MAG: biotin/lipoyl-binding protein, partial [Candidatus Omnitrophica bacterium]|nr:biotin/lipoyl-binding protein [Candidatus Omnitrophota bacterium]
MIKNKNKIITAVILIFIVILLFKVSGKGQEAGTNSSGSIIQPVIGDVSVTVSTTGIIEPQNRLEIKPSISGRIEDILVREGDRVEIGDILAWMSSTERSALMDAARSQSSEALKYWEEAYKKTPIISPI